MPCVAVCRERRIERPLTARVVLGFVFPADFFVIVIAAHAAALPVSGALFAVEQVFERWHGAIVQVGRGCPDAIERRRDVALRHVEVGARL